MLNRTHPLIIVTLLMFFALAAGCSSGGGILPGVNEDGNVLEAASFEGGDNFVDLTDEGLTLTLTDDNGAPLPEVEVYLDGELADYTDENGEYTLYGLTEENSELSFAIEEVELFSTTINNVSRTAQTSDPDPDIQRGKVFGIVRDIDGPVKHALVMIIRGWHFAFDWSNEDGEYLIEDAPVGPGKILCFAKKHKPFTDGIVVLPDDAVQKNIFLTQVHRLRPAWRPGGGRAHVAGQACQGDIPASRYAAEGDFHQQVRRVWIRASACRPRQDQDRSFRVP